MALTIEQQKFIEDLNNEAKRILHDGNKEELLKSLWGKMDKLQEIMASSTGSELNDYCEKYDGFYLYMKMLEELAGACSEGVFKDILN